MVVHDEHLARWHPEPVEITLLARTVKMREDFVHFPKQVGDGGH